MDFYFGARVSTIQLQGPFGVKRVEDLCCRVSWPMVFGLRDFKFRV